MIAGRVTVRLSARFRTSSGHTLALPRVLDIVLLGYIHVSHQTIDCAHIRQERMNEMEHIASVNGVPTVITPEYAQTVIRHTVAKYAALTDAVKAIKGDCDGTRTRDGVGFSRADLDFAWGIAEKSPYSWTPKMRHVAHKMMRKYRVQLAENHGIDFDAIPVPPVPTEELTALWKTCKAVDYAAYQSRKVRTA